LLNAIRPESELVSLQMKFQKSIDSTSNAVTLLDKKYRLLVDSANEAIVVIKGGFLCLTNPITRQLPAIRKKKIGTIPFHLFIHPEDRARVV